MWGVLYLQKVLVPPDSIYFPDEGLTTSRDLSGPNVRKWLQLPIMLENRCAILKPQILMLIAILLY